DIVSGDFYFFHKRNNQLFIAVADCTGHGVPGALLSILSITKLAETIALYSSTEEILFHLNQKIKLALNQNSSRNSNVDGMDIALCRLDTDTNTLEFSGANRPLWIIRKNTGELEEIKSTRRTIAGFTPFDQTFPSNTLSINKGDVFYMFSDGYPDAIGGPYGKKLMTKSFKEILLSISHKSMPEQKDHLGSFNRNWRGHTKQNDDILVVGIRV
ncbi:MAG: SpoIIE family protein phosphatase, partial [Bacteroidia bacterium]|nr:SpoIIE family protein phosphatase [Bacteroidia bacterium]